MENNNVFNYHYSASRNSEIEKIRKKYIPKEVDKLEELKELDRRIQTAGLIPSLTVGIVGCLIFGIGMCFGLDVFAGRDWLTVLFCILGIGIMLPAYPVFRHISRKTKATLVPRILQLSDDIMNQR
ncbi:MAG: hypothetical protein IJY08_01790 [Clostridia bacterium]|nr:hypothetical protein [Clostridia bacterium]